MKIAFLTSSRADYGIYLPLLKAMQHDKFFDIRLIVFGTHLSSFHGYTVESIFQDGFNIDYEVTHVMADDSEEAVATSMSVAFSKFVGIWAAEKDNYDLVFCLGDRYEMFSAVSAASPYRIPFAHIHGGETTLGAIDNEYRHCLTVFSSLHFTSTDVYAERVTQIKGSKSNVYAVGSLSLDNLVNLHMLSLDEFRQQYHIDLSIPSLLVTYHPETVNTEGNKKNAEELIIALKQLEEFQVVITMPNADAMGNTMRQVYEAYAREDGRIKLVENFGTAGYFNCMNHAALVVGNSSSGIIEAASFHKYVVNIGGRQNGRAVSANVIQCDAEATSIEKACRSALQKGRYEGENIYYRKNVSQQIIQAVKTWGL